MNEFLIVILLVMWTVFMAQMGARAYDVEPSKCPPHKWETREDKLVCTQCGYKPEGGTNEQDRDYY